MKKLILIIAGIVIMRLASIAQNTTGELENTVARLDRANDLPDLQLLASRFRRIAEARKTNWLSWYYAALCNAKIGSLNDDDRNDIEPYKAKANEEIQWALALLDTTQKKELSEVYCVLSIINRDIVYMNPVTYKREYGPAASKYMRLAVQANPENPRALYLDGWEKFAIPIKSGGDKTAAKKLLISAKQKLNTNESFSVDPHWGKAEVDAILKQL